MIKQNVFKPISVNKCIFALTNFRNLRNYSMRILFLIILLSFANFVSAQNVVLQGKVTDEDGMPLEDATVSTQDGKYAVDCSRVGEFRLSMPKKYKLITVYRLGYEAQLLKTDSLLKEAYIHIKLLSLSNIEEVTIEGEKLNSSGNIKIDASISNIIPSINESVENIIRTQAGVVGARSQLSSQYAVRGGNYDENLVYVNGIEVYRPKLVRSGNQEGLSFLNPLMVSSVKFSAGGFESKYGDNMSSVLDVRYKKPRGFAASVSASFLGASAFIQNLNLKGRLSHISSLRYKTNRFVLNTLNTKGDYKPAFIDFQSYWNYKFKNNFNLNFLVNLSDNEYLFYPESRRTTFGTISKSYGIFVGYEGREKDRFSVYTGILNLDWHPQKNLMFSLAASYTHADEKEFYDIEALYSLNELEGDLSADNVGDSILNLGTGMLLKHARNKLKTDIYSLVHKASLKAENHYLQWGVNWKFRKIYDITEEWEMLDSAGYSIPYNNSSIMLYKSYAYKNRIENQMISAFFQDKYNFTLNTSEFETIFGARLTHSFFSKEWLFSPRASMAYRPDFAKKHTFRFATGYYYRPPFYKALKTFDGVLNFDSKSQKSIHFVLSDEYLFSALGRDLVLNVSLYYKILKDQIPFEVDNVSVKYYANQRSNGYAAGLDLRVSGEFVPGADSWFSLSLLKTEEDIKDIGNGNDDGYGYIPRPTDQFFNASLFLQDYLPTNKNFKAHLNFVYGSPFVFGPPEEGRHADTLRSTGYKRVDLGASVVLLRGKLHENRKFLRFFKSIWFTVEFFNLLDIENTVSYTWLRVVPNSAIPEADNFAQYATPNRLTSRMLNLKLQIKF